MAFKVFKDGSIPQAQQVTVTFSDTTSTHTNIAKLTDTNTGSSESITYTNGGSETTTTIAAALAAAIQASGLPLFINVSASASGAVLTLTSDIPGMPFSLDFSTGTASPAPAQVTITSNSGPGDLLSAGNYADNVAPSSGDDIAIVGTASPKWNLYQSGTTYGKLTTDKAWSGTIGQPGVPLACGWTSVKLYGTGTAHLNVGSSAIAVDVYGNVRGTLLGSALTTVNCEAGAMNIAPYGGQTATLTKLVVKAKANVIVGPGVTLTTVDQIGGVLELNCAATTLNLMAGACITQGSGTYTTVNNYACKMISNSSGTISTLNTKGGEQGYVDFTQSRLARTVTASNLGGDVFADTSVITFTGTPTQYRDGSLKAGAVGKGTSNMAA